MSKIKEHKWIILLGITLVSVIFNVSTCTQSDRTTTLESENRYLENELDKEHRKQKEKDNRYNLKLIELDSVIRRNQFIEIKYEQAINNVNVVNDFPSLDSLLTEFYRQL